MASASLLEAPLPPAVHGPVRERPILFSGPMVRAILDGRKTQTRRVVQLHEPHVVMDERDDGSPWPWADGAPDEQGLVECPHGRAGDRLWVREAHALVPTTAYRASDGVPQTVNPADADQAAIYRAGWERSMGGLRWRPSIHMPRWAARLTLAITAVRVERLHALSLADARAEAPPEYKPVLTTHQAQQRRGTTSSADEREDYRHLWDALNAKRGYGFATNPWVWVLTFRRVEASHA